MSELPAVDALRNKRSELMRLMSRLERQLAQHRGNLTHLDATMRLFSPDMLSQDTDATRPSPAAGASVVVPSRRMPAADLRRAARRSAAIGNARAGRSRHGGAGHAGL